MIALEGVGKLYGRRWAIRDLTCHVRPGEVLGFLGPNGAGKTTTLRIVTGYMPPTTGSVRVAGIDGLEHPLELKRHVGYLPETPPVYGEMTVRGYLLFVAEIRGVGRRHRRGHVDEVMERAGVAGVADRLGGRLSRGYRQRVGLAAALVGDPPVLVLDEPTAGMDPQQITEMRRLIKSLAGQHTIILSSHILPEVASTCDRVLILNNGRLVAQDSPGALSARLRGARHLQIEVKGPRDAVEAALSEVGGIQEATLRPVAGDNRSEADTTSPVPARWRVDLQLAAPVPRDRPPAPPEAGAGAGVEQGESLEDRVRQQLFFALAERRLPLLEMRLCDWSLEDVFLKLVTEEDGVNTA